MISGSASCFPNASQGLQMYPVAVAAEDIVSSSLEAAGSGPEAHPSSLLYNLSILKDKVRQVQSLVSILISPDQTHTESTSFALASMGSLVQEIILTASSMLFLCQQMSLETSSGNDGRTTDQMHQQHVRVIPDNGISHSHPPNFTDNSVGNIVQEKGQGFYNSSSETISWYDDRCNDPNNNDNNSNNRSLQVRNDHDMLAMKELAELTRGSEISEGSKGVSAKNYDVVELDAADLLAKYTHYCQVCGKGFKRDANLRMHMRAHGDEYKTTAALINPTKNHEESTMGNGSTKLLPKKYSCPQVGCRWNQKHAKFQPLKSMICVKNHYKRSHCPKMYVCKRCNRKQFSVLSDLRTHEKHCGDLRWQCSCGTTFSRKDKLMGHVALFVGHSPLAIDSWTMPGKLEHQATTTTMQLDDRG